MRGGGEEVLDEILIVGLGADHALAAPALRAVVGHAGALDEAEVRDGHDAAFVGHEKTAPVTVSPSDVGDEATSTVPVLTSTI